MRIEEINGIPLADYKYTYLLIHVENVALSQATIGEGTVNINRESNNASAMLSMGTGFLMTTTKKYWAGCIDTKTGQALSIQTPVGFYTWRGTIQMMANMQEKGQIIKSINVSAVSPTTVVPAGTIIKGWLK